MPFCGLLDVNVHLPADKAQALDADIPNLVIDAERLVRARLAVVVEPSVMADWDVEAALPVGGTCPEIIRKITGLIVAAKFYSKLVAEDEADGSEFAQELYNQAIAIINEIRDGTTLIIGVDGEPIETTSIDETSFWPNETTQPPFFKVADVWS